MSRLFYQSLIAPIAVLICFSFSFPALLTAQKAVNIHDYIPMTPSAEQSVFGRFGGVDVDYYTGRVAVQLPLTEVNTGRLQLSVALTYNQEGIPINEVAGPTGLGWNLAAGGEITRLLNGLPDNITYSMPRLNTSLARQQPNEDAYYHMEQYGGEVPEYDSEPDLFAFNFLGYSGRFIYNVQTHELRQIEASDIKIESFNPATNVAILVDPKGTRYHFGYHVATGSAIEETRIFHNALYQTTYISSWKLVRIESFDREEWINLKYISNGSYHVEGVNPSYVDDAGNEFRITGSVCGSSDLYLFPRPQDNPPSTLLRPIGLSEINWNRGKLLFNYNIARSDVSNTNYKALGSIEVQGLSGVCLSKTNFTYGSFSTSNGGAPRLRLSEVATISCSTTSTSPAPLRTKFRYVYQGESLSSYNITSLSGLQFPWYQSYAVDHYGYYRGSGGRHLVPTPRLNISRDPAWPYTATGLLAEIEYPTGGVKQIQYEPNKYRTPNATVSTTGPGARVAKIIERSSNSVFSPTKTTQYTYDETTAKMYSGPVYTFDYQNRDIALFYATNINCESLYDCDNLCLGSVDGAALGSISIGVQVQVKKNPFNGALLGYGKTSVTVAGQGKITYEFNEPGAIYSASNNAGSVGISSTPFVQPTLLSGKLKSETYYNTSNQIIGRNVTNYSTTVLGSFEGFNVGRLITPEGFADRLGCNQGSCLFYYPHAYNPGVAPDYRFTYTNYAITFGRILKTAESKLQDGVTTTTNYLYRSDFAHLNPTEVNVTNSDGLVHKMIYGYAREAASNSWAQRMVALNMVAIPLATTNTLDGGYLLTRSEYQLLSGSQNGTYPQPYKLYSSTKQSHSPSKEIERYTIVNGLITEIVKFNTLRTKVTIDRAPGTNLITSITYPGGGVDRYDYYPNTPLLRFKQDRRGQHIRYLYDQLQRPVTIVDQFSAYGNVANWNLNNTTYRSKTDISYRIAPSERTNGELPSVTTTVHYGDDTPSVSTKAIYDAFGRNLATVKINQGPDNNTDLLTELRRYNGNGQLEESYLNFTASTLPSSTSGLTSAGRMQYDIFNRVVRVTNADGSFVVTSFGANSSSDAVRRYVNGVYNGTYATASLQRKIDTDEDGKSTHTFTDKVGRTVMVRRFNNAVRHDTYYLFDRFSQLAYVLPPSVTDPNSEAAYRYVYDTHFRLQQKKIPGKATEWFYYDESDRMLLRQDGKMVEDFGSNHYHAYTYDAMGNLTEHSSGSLRSGVPQASSGHVNQPVILDGRKKLSGFRYAIDNDLEMEEHLILDGGSPRYTRKTYTYDAEQHYLERTALESHLGQFQITYTTNDAGLQTRVASQQQQSPYLINTQERTYDAAQRLRDQFYQVAVGDATFFAPRVQSARYEYDLQNNVRELNLGKYGSTWLQSVDYAYDNRNRLITINGGLLNTNSNVAIADCAAPTYSTLTNTNPEAGPTSASPDLFALRLTYNTPLTGTGTAGAKNGNVSGVQYQHITREPQGYGFTYDGLNRLTQATYTDYKGSSMQAVTGRYSTTYSYDQLGNITRLTRQGALNNCPNGAGFGYTYGLLDDLTYRYATDNPNKLISVADAGVPHLGFLDQYSGAVEYGYDANGNVIFDNNKWLEIEYNHLNLPSRFYEQEFDAELKVIYNAAGEKLRTISTFNNQTKDYIQGFELVNGFAKTFQHEHGFVDIVYELDHYAVKDHLSSTRVVFADANRDRQVATHEVKQINQYYPFGMEMRGPWNPVGAQHEYLYTGKEKAPHLGLHGIGLYDYGARWYDPAVARWNAVDPLADHENQVDKSPYAYGWNSPVRYSDPDGRCPQCPAAGVAAGVGFLFGAAYEMYSQRNESSYDWGSVFTSGLKSGGTAGLVTLAGPGALSLTGATTTTGTIATMGGVGGLVAGGVEATGQLITTGTVDGVGVGGAVLGGTLGGGIGGGLAGPAVRNTVTTAGTTSARQTLTSSTSARAVVPAQRAASDILGPGATNAQIAATRSAVRAEINTAASATYNSSVAATQRTAATQGAAAGAATSTTTNKSTQSLYQRVVNWWNEN